MPASSAEKKLSRDDFISPQRSCFYQRAPKRTVMRLRVANAKNPERLYAKVVAHFGRGLAQQVLRVGSGSSVTREAVARYLNAPVHQVEQVFARLRREGLMSAERNDGAHDTNRAWFFAGSGTGWAPTYWSLRNAERWYASAGVPTPAPA